MVFVSLVNSLRDRREVPIDPQLEKVADDRQRELLETQELKHGAVRSAVLAQGSGAAVTDGDVLLLRVRCCQGNVQADQVTRMAQGVDADGGTLCAAAMGAGQRLPRGWELILADMREGQTNTAITSAAFGFQASGMAPIDGVKANSAMTAILHLARVLPSTEAKPLAAHPEIIKIVRAKGNSWQTPRAPCEVTLSIAVTCPHPAFEALDSSLVWQQRHATLGRGHLAPKVEAAVGSMTASESALFIMPRSEVVTSTSTELPELGTQAASRGGHVLLHVRLENFVEVRDMTGDGRVLKRKLQEGQGTFPIDAPVNDAAVRMHYSVALASEPKTVVFSTRGADDTTPAIEVTTGEGALPAGLEMALKLMLPGEKAAVTVHPDFGYETCTSNIDPAPPADMVLVFEVELVSFDSDGHPEAMSCDEVIVHTTKLKDAANELYRGGRLKFAICKYDRAVAIIKKCRDADTDKQAAALTALQVTLLANLAAAYMAQKDYPQAVRCCDAAFELDDTNHKVVLRRGKASNMNGDFEEARSACAAIAQSQADADLKADAKALLETVRQREAAAHKKQKAQFSNFL